MIKRLFCVLALFAVFGSSALAQGKQVIYADSIDASANIATATSSAAGFEAYKLLRTDIDDFTDRAITFKFAKTTDSVKVQVATVNFGTDTTWTDVLLKSTLTAGLNTGAGSAVVRDTARTWITSVGDNDMTPGPFYLDRKYIGKKWRVVSGVLDTGKIYFQELRMPRR